MDIVNGTMYNPTNISVSISNAGIFSGKIHPFTETVYKQNINIGKMKMSSLRTIANKKPIVSLSSVLHIKSITQFIIIHHSVFCIDSIEKKCTHY